jgi:hypothetical protein
MVDHVLGFALVSDYVAVLAIRSTCGKAFGGELDPEQLPEGLVASLLG